MSFVNIVVAHSPDSDDAFMFYGLASGAVDVEGIEVDQVLADIETLNRSAFEGKYEVTAVSFHAYAHLLDRYALLPHGASMGDQYGPILVATRAILATEGAGDLRGLKIGIPGTLTSAYLTLQMFDPDFEAVVMPFDEIQQAVVDGNVDAGLLIHEGQLTYASDGLRKVVDLGEWWFARTGGLPLPLGGNVIRRDLGPQLMQKISRMLHDSIAHALNNRDAAVDYAQQFGRGLDRKDTDTFVGMYANQLTLDYGTRGRAGLERFFAEAFEKGLIPNRVPVEFVQ
jgi:1,4-dihydroxy-6-naphthoate synthase